MILEDNPQEPAHIERGMADPTKSTSLHLVCRGIHRQQGDGRGAGLPITINLLQVLKEQLRISAFLCHTGATGVTGSVCCGLLWLFPCERTNAESLLVNHCTILGANVCHIGPVKDRPLFAVV